MDHKFLDRNPYFIFIIRLYVYNLLAQIPHEAVRRLTAFVT